VQQLIYLDVHEEAKPERLHEMEDRSLLAVQEAQSQNVAIREVEERPDVQGHSPPHLLERESFLIRVPEQ
jgi:hypothetical protein